MKRICLVLAGVFLYWVGVMAQVADTSAYRPRKLTLSEAGFVSSYYHQDGNNSAVTGGIGTEKLTDFSNGFEVKMYRYTSSQKRFDLDMNLGVDYYTSASSDKIDASSISSASARDLRIYPSVTGKWTSEEKGSAISGTLSYSHESDYRSFGIRGGVFKKSADRNREFYAQLQFYFDRVKIILPYELRTLETGGITGAPNQYDYPWTSRNTFASSFGLSQVVNQRLKLMFLFDPAYQQGYLGLPFHRVYFNNNDLRNEKLPRQRMKWPLGVRASWFVGDRLVFRPYYRFYTDSWELSSHTAELEFSYHVSPSIYLIPFYRYYTQTSAAYFAAYQQHKTSDAFYTSNYDLSSFESNFYGMGIKHSPLHGLFGINCLQTAELRYGHYSRSNGLKADILSINLKIKTKKG
jgi:hypothetical protein